jgi:hypothetical protein
VPYARRAPGQLPWAPFAARRTHRFCLQACRTSPCTWKGCSYVPRRRPREGAPCLRSRLPLPPTASRLPTLVTSPPRYAWMAQPLVTHAFFAPATPLPAPRRTSCLQPLPVAPCPVRHPRGLVSPGFRTGPSSMLSRLPLLPWQVRVGDPQAASAALSATPSGPTPLFPTPSPAARRPLLSRGSHSPCPRPAVARARPPSPIPASAAAEEADDAERPTPPMLPLVPMGHRRRRGDAYAGVGWV